MFAAVRRPAARLASSMRAWLAAALLVLTLTATAAAQTPEDPLEPLNRKIFGFNQVVDGAFVEPAAIMYEGVVPGFVRARVHNVFLNLTEPVNLLNAALQGNGERFGDAFGRLFINTTLGFGGLFDVAANLEPPYDRHYASEDFGQTMAVWGWRDSAYFVVPVLGPSTVRDTVGLPADFAATPPSFFAPTGVSLALSAGRAVDARSQVLDELEELERSSLDFYASLRSVFLQRRRNEIFNGNPPPQDGDTMFEEDEFFAE
ncbi:MAG: VacJ family lipoprotein [Alphaproteobacteria bacterium]|jgi:phospholipid-binding lipoprotein MlaA|nr:VacJ family lipoprotein [Alphaproteobacteria bacterium]